MRDYTHIDRYLNELQQDIYSQPPDEGHTGMIAEVFVNWIDNLDFDDVLDVGCGANAVAADFFYSLWRVKGEYTKKYVGISLGEKNQIQMDMSFLNLQDNSFDLIWCRHTLEHSPMPLLTLMEFHRVSNRYLCLIMPNPDYFTYLGRNHYFVSNQHQIAWWLRRAGWQIIKSEMTEEEFRFLCLKQPRVSYEGYEYAPLRHAVYAFERDMLDVGATSGIEQLEMA